MVFCESRRNLNNHRPDQYRIMASYHVLYDEDKKHWEVKKENGVNASATAPTKADAKDKAAKLAKNNKPSYVYLHYKWAQSELDPVQDVVPYS